MVLVLAACLHRTSTRGESACDPRATARVYANDITLLGGKASSEANATLVMAVTAAST
jgi:hypothetical protein